MLIKDNQTHNRELWRSFSRTSKKNFIQISDMHCNVETMKARKVVGVEQHNYKKKTGWKVPVVSPRRVSVTLNFFSRFLAFVHRTQCLCGNCTSLICNEEAVDEPQHNGTLWFMRWHLIIIIPPTPYTVDNSVNVGRDVNHYPLGLLRSIRNEIANKLAFKALRRLSVHWLNCTKSRTITSGCTSQYQNVA